MQPKLEWGSHDVGPATGCQADVKKARLRKDRMWVWAGLPRTRSIKKRAPRRNPSNRFTDNITTIQYNNPTAKQEAHSIVALLVVMLVSSSLRVQYETSLSFASDKCNA